MAAARYDLTLEPGSTFELQLTWKDSAGALVNLTGYTAESQVRSGYAAADPPALEFAAALGGAAGTIVLTASATATEALTIGRGVWDLELTPPAGEPFRMLYGNVNVIAQVTR